MECHKREHRASARCASALLAAGALLATAADHLDGSSSRPALGLAAVGIPQAPQPAPEPEPGPAPTDQKAPASAPVQAQGQTKAAEAAPDAAAQSAGPQARTAPERPGAATSRKTKPPGKPARGSTATHPKQTAPAKKSVAKRLPVKKAPPKKASSKHPPTKSGSALTHLPPPANPKAAKAVREALSLMGVPYRWGGTTRAGFDCSGFTQHVWAAAGVKIPRTVRQQAQAGTPIPLNKAQPGDLVVFYPSRHHVGIYIGNGLVVDSPHPGSGVRTDPVRSMPVSIVVRPHM